MLLSRVEIACERIATTLVTIPYIHVKILSPQYFSEIRCANVI
jgi:hypothetical protein